MSFRQRLGGQAGRGGRRVAVCSGARALGAASAPQRRACRSVAPARALWHCARAPFSCFDRAFEVWVGNIPVCLRMRSERFVDELTEILLAVPQVSEVFPKMRKPVHAVRFAEDRQGGGARRGIVQRRGAVAAGILQVCGSCSWGWESAHPRLCMSDRVVP